MDAKEEEKQLNTPNSWNEYEQAYPERARLVRSYEAYGVLISSDHARFWDDQVYDNLKKALDTDNPVMHQGVRLYYSDQHNQANARITANLGRVPGSTAEYCAIAIRQLREDRKELEEWKIAEPDEFEKAKELIEIILAGNLHQVGHDKLVGILRSSIFHFPGIAFSYRIKKNEEVIKESSEVKTPEPPFSPRKNTARERYQEYLRQQAQKKGISDK